MSDIHGCYNEFKQMLKYIDFNHNDLLILLGDYIDRGTQNIEMINWIKDHNKNQIILRGNHEEEFINNIGLMDQINIKNELKTDYSSYIDTQLLYESCVYEIKKQGKSLIKYFDYYKTIKQLIYDNKICFDLLLQYANMFSNLKYVYEKDRYIFVHAGYIDKLINNKYNSLNDFYLYARDDAYLEGGKPNKIIISGHTPTIFQNEFCYNDGDVFHYYNKNNNCYYYNIDCGISYRKENPSSQLCCLRLDDFNIIYI